MAIKNPDSFTISKAKYFYKILYTYLFSLTSLNLTILTRILIISEGESRFFRFRE